MEGTILTVKFAMFLAMELFVVSTLGAALIAGLVEIIRSKVSESHYLDEITPKAHSLIR